MQEVKIEHSRLHLSVCVSYLLSVEWNVAPVLSLHACRCGRSRVRRSQIVFKQQRQGGLMRQTEQEFLTEAAM